MKKLNIISFSPSTFDNRPEKGTPQIRFHNNRHFINADAVKLMHLKVDDFIKLHQDLDNPATWYLSKETTGFKLCRYKTAGTLCFYNQPIFLTIKGCFSLEAGFSMMVGREPIKHNNTLFWPLTLVTDSTSQAEEEPVDSTADQDHSESPSTPVKRRGRPKKQAEEPTQFFEHDPKGII